MVPFQQYSMPDQTWGEWFWGSNPKIMQTNRFNQQQMGGLQNILGSGLQGMQNLQQNQFSFDPIAANARRQFQQTTVPTLAERFTSMGRGPGGQRSSAFANILGGAGADLESQLASLGAQYGLQNQGQQMNYINSLLGLGLTQPFENNYIPGTSGFFGSLMGPAIQGATDLGVAYGKQRMGGDNSGQMAALLKLLAMAA